jgi:hypothetical protein
MTQSVGGAVLEDSQVEAVVVAHRDLVVDLDDRSGPDP